jgi:hypothetical protein
MKKINLTLILISGLFAMNASAQLRYKNEIFTNSQIQVAKGIPFATNLNWLIINQTDLGTPANMPQVIGELTDLKTRVALKQSFPLKYYVPKGTPGGTGDTTILKVTTLRMDAYMPDPSLDAGVKRPVVIYLHTGNFLPPGTNGSPCGDKGDSVVVDICKGLARRGFIALAIDYRLGWNPIGATLDIRRGTLLNAVYRSIHDVKECVRLVKGANMAAYNIDTTKIGILGEGTGGYIALAYNALDKYPEFMNLPKFTGYIDTARVGKIDGSGGIFNLYTKSTIGTKVQVIGNIGGALADSSWLEAGDAPIVSMHSVRDPFAPFGYGLVIVPPPINQPVVEVDGANNTIMRAQRLGINSVFASIPSSDPYTTKARSLYNRTIDYIYPAPEDKITIRSGEGMYPFILPKGASVFTNQASPWQWWDSASKEAKVIVAAPSTTAHMASIGSNLDMSRTKSRLYQDTIFGYMIRRFGVAMNLLTANELGIKSPKVTGVNVYPNPATNSVSINYHGIINSIIITDISGKTVFESSVNSTSLTIPSLNLSQGLYLMNISTEHGNTVEKLVIN